MQNLLLTRREEEIIVHVSNGLLSKEIGDKLGIHRKTVEKHREHIKFKMMELFALKSFTIADFVHYAIAKKLVKLKFSD